MRLINVQTLKLAEFFGANLPHYAILSHRWENEEVSFQDFTSGRGRDMIGWRKVIGCCQLARKDNLKWAWIDSCCIDKSSSAELSEAINSMFRWYRDAEVCYAYLSDVSGNMNERGTMDEFRFSKWFTRGWTLQELLAPDELRFFDSSWRQIGTKEGWRDTISKVTGIKHLFNFQDASVAQKMSWAAKRETTRLEDQAYCLLGIFGVNMPPLYGESLGAFLRLQLEVMRISNDESIFAWEDQSVSYGGLLAPSPSSFRYSSDIIAVDVLQRRPYSMTNKGLEISVQLSKPDFSSLRIGYFDQDEYPHLRVAPLNCAREEINPGNQESTLLSVVVEPDGDKGDNYQRTQCQILPSYELAENEEYLQGEITVWVKQQQIALRTYRHFKIYARQLHLELSNGWEIADRKVLNSELGRWGSDDEGCLHLKLSNTAATVVFQHALNTRSRFILKISSSGKVASVSLITSRLGYSETEILEGISLPYQAKHFAFGEIIEMMAETSSLEVKAIMWIDGSGGRDTCSVDLNAIRITEEVD